MTPTVWHRFNLQVNQSCGITNASVWTQQPVANHKTVASLTYTLQNTLSCDTGRQAALGRVEMNLMVNPRWWPLTPRLSFPPANTWQTSGTDDLPTTVSRWPSKESLLEMTRGSSRPVSRQRALTSVRQSAEEQRSETGNPGLSTIIYCWDTGIVEGIPVNPTLRHLNR